MHGEHLSLSKSSLAYAKIAATPTDSAWSQVYNAGNLFACLSLTVKEHTEEQTLLQNLGKELFNNLEAEFFTLEEKTLDTIREAILKSTKHIPAAVTANFCLAYFKDHTLYLFLLGSGRVVMKRGEKLGILLEKKPSSTQTEHHDAQHILTASGYLTNEDTIIIETNQFAKNVSDKHIADALQLELPNDIAESLSIHMHEQADGDQAAIIIVYHGKTVQPIVQTNKESTILEDEDEAEEETLPQSYPPMQEKASSKAPLVATFSGLISRIHLPFPRHNRRIVMGGLTHRKKFFLSIVCILVLLLVVSIVFTKQKQETSKNASLFAAIYTPALKSYDEGKALMSLNEPLSKEDFLKAEKLLLDGRDTFPKDSQEDKQIEELLTKVQAELDDSPETTATTNGKEIPVAETTILALEKANPDGLGFSQNDTTVYYVTPQEAISITKKDKKKTELVTNDDDWKQAVAIVPYQTNFYILDQKNGVLKYVPTGNTFSKSDYFTTAPDLTKAVSMAIDSSIWILFSDGSIKKYIRGKEDVFTIKGLTKPLKNPTKIYTNPDIANVYILDNGNARIVKLATDGTFQKEYPASSIKSAKDFEVLESDKKIHILSGDKVWELEI